jgi:hypothetical protein
MANNSLAQFFNYHTKYFSEEMGKYGDFWSFYFHSAIDEFY